MKQVETMKQIRDKVGGLDVRRDSVVACTRITQPAGAIEAEKERLCLDSLSCLGSSPGLLDTSDAPAGFEHRPIISTVL